MCVAWLAFAFLTFTASAAPTNLVFQLSRLRQMNPHTAAGLTNLAQKADELLAAATARQKEIKAEAKRIRRDVGLDNLSHSNLVTYFHGSTNNLTKHEILGVSAIADFSHAALNSDSPRRREQLAGQIDEVMAALRNDRRPTLPTHIGPGSIFTAWLTGWSRRVGKGTRPAADLTGTNEDLSRRDPIPSTFWERPANIPAQNLLAGFHRATLPHYTNAVWNYDEPKDTSGVNAGFKAVYQGQYFRVKFGEFHSEPFTARMFDALGYHVDPTDYAPFIKIRYSRRIFREFNLREPLTIHLAGPFGIPIGSLQLQPYRDPFHYVTAAVFKDGRRITGAELKGVLLFNPRQQHPEDDPKNFRPDIEAALDYLVMSPADIRPKEGSENIGSWQFDGLGHENLRALRGAGLLVAWLGFCDTRWDNTRLRLQGDSLVHVFSDLGGGLGNTRNWFVLHGERPNEFPWTFTRPEVTRGPGQMTTPFRITGFWVIEPTAAYHDMTADDARWMARLIGQLNEVQIRGALIASGYSAAEVRIYQEKLVSRRDRMIQDLGLGAEIPPLRPARLDWHLHFDPPPGEPAAIPLMAGHKAVAPVSHQIIRNGKLVGPPIAMLTSVSIHRPSIATH